MNERNLYLGMISGTSRDGVDTAVVEFKNTGAIIHAAHCFPYPPQLAMELEKQVRRARRPNETVLRQLDAELADVFAESVSRLMADSGLAAAEITAIGSHGQTVWHDPDGNPPETLQSGDPARLASRTGITVVGDFRSADVAAGGQGAPLAPLLHQALFHTDNGVRIVLNLGGIANISILGPQGDVAGFDTGPANCLLDAWIQACRNESLDRNGAWGASGRVDSDFLAELLTDDYFGKPGPKSTGIEYFNPDWLNRKLNGRSLPAEDVQATLVELTARSVCDAINSLEATDVLVCGGGVHNTFLMQRIAANLPGIPVHSTASEGLDPDWVEAVLFAWLARERLEQRLMDTRVITGARHPVLMGTIEEPAAVK